MKIRKENLRHHEKKHNFGKLLKETLPKQESAVILQHRSGTRESLIFLSIPNPSVRIEAFESFTEIYSPLKFQYTDKCTRYEAYDYNGMSRRLEIKW